MVRQDENNFKANKGYENMQNVKGMLIHLLCQLKRSTRLIICLVKHPGEHCSIHAQGF